MNTDKYVVTCVDYGETADGKPRVLGIFNTRKEAEDYVEKDIDGYNDSGNYECVNYEEMWIYTDSSRSNGCEWNIEPIAVPA